MLVVESYAWAGNALPGNDFWLVSEKALMRIL